MYHNTFSFTCSTAARLLSTFVFAIPYLRYPEESAHVLITTSSTEPVATTVYVPGIQYRSNHFVSKSNPLDVALPYDVLMLENEGKREKTVIVRASDNVSVFVIDNEVASGDGFMAIESTHLGTRYYVGMASHEPVYDHTYFFCISSTNNNTSVKIKLKIGDEIPVFLNTDESFRYDSNVDLTGTYIESDNPIAVVSGGIYGHTLDPAHAEGAVMQVQPIKNWGRRFVMGPFMSILSGYRYRVITASDSTSVYINQNRIVIREAGDFYEGNVAVEEVVSIESNHPVMVYQLMKEFRANNQRGNYAMVIIPPEASYTNTATFPVLQYTYDGHGDYYTNVVIQCDMMNGLLFDGTHVTSEWDHLSSSDGTMCVTRGEVSTGVHSVSHEDPSVKFTLSVYGICDCSSAYIYPAGIAYENINIEGK